VAGDHRRRADADPARRAAALPAQRRHPRGRQGLPGRSGDLHLSNLLTAAIKLPRCCVVIANLSGSYDAQTKDLARIMSNLQQESRRQAQTITPVQLAGNEIYEILKKRLFTELPDEP
jgi:hypothetical protein